MAAVLVVTPHCAASRRRRRRRCCNLDTVSRPVKLWTQQLSAVLIVAALSLRTDASARKRDHSEVLIRLIPAPTSEPPTPRLRHTEATAARRRQHFSVEHLFQITRASLRGRLLPCKELGVRPSAAPSPSSRVVAAPAALTDKTSEQGCDRRDPNSSFDMTIAQGEPVYRRYIQHRTPGPSLDRTRGQ